MTDDNVQKNSPTPATESTTAGHRNELPPLQFDVDLGPPVLRPLLAGKFRVDCTRILLKGASDGESKKFAGPGYIAQTETEVFAITIFVAGPPPSQNIPMSGGVPGTLLSSSGTLSLEATDISGRIWHAENIWTPEPSGRLGGDGYILCASCHELVLRRSSRSIEGHSLELWVRGHLDFPFPAGGKLLPIMEQQNDGEPVGRCCRTTVLAYIFQSCGFDFTVFHHHGNFGLRAVGSKPPPRHFGPRVWESMLFALAGPLNWSAMRIASDGMEELRIRSPRARPTPEGFPPILHHLYPPPYDTWRIFDCYLRYVLAGPQPAEPKLHPLSSQVFWVRNSADASLEAQSLALTVAVEAVLGEFFPELGAPAEADVKAIGTLKSYLEGWKTELEAEGDADEKSAMERLKKRVLGAISNFKKPGVKDRLHALQERGFISGGGVGAWKPLRNAATHGDWRELRSGHQKWVDRIGAARTLFHQIIFHLIDYKGLQTDYGTRGYPPVPYPPTPKDVAP